MRKDDTEVGHYYLGEVDIDLKSVEDIEDGIGDGQHKEAKMNLILKHPVEYGIFRFFESRLE